MRCAISKVQQIPFVFDYFVPTIINYMHRLFFHLYVPRISQIFLSSTITAFPQLTQAILTSFVALTLIPQRGQIYFLVLDGLRIGVGLSVGI